jgi:hypothetical protein
MFIELKLLFLYQQYIYLYMESQVKKLTKKDSPDFYR